MTAQGHASDTVPGASLPDAMMLRHDMLALLPDLRGFARFLVKEPAAADDLVQDTVVRALGHLEQFRNGTNLKAWLFTILRNLFFEQARRRRREAEAVNAQALPEQAGQGGQTTPGEMRDLERFLWLLSPLLRESLVLVGAQELTYEEAAIICGVPPGTVKVRVSRARQQLARLMQASTAEVVGHFGAP